MKRHCSVVYHIDADNRIVYVNDEWDAFAAENQAENLSGREVLNFKIWKYIQGDEVKHVLNEIFKKVRETSKCLSFEYRCDSPELKRLLNMKVSLIEGGLVSIENTVREIESRKPVCVQKITRDSSFVKMCSWCKRMKTDQWVELEEGIGSMGYLTEETVPKITHTICPECKVTIMEKLAEAHKENLS